MTKGHTQLDSIGDNAMADPFGTNTAASLAYKKVERLVTATHMVTNHVPKSEVLREKIRDTASNLLSDTIRLRSGFASMGKGAIDDVIAHVRLLLSMLDTLYASGLISEMNVRVLKEAYKDFVQNLSAMASGSLSDAVSLTPEYFSPTESPYIASSVTKEAPLLASGKKARTQDSGLKRVVVKTVSPKVATLVRSAGATNSDRVNTIIDIVTKRKSVSIGDIAQLITGCSTKTLQRDLAKLVQGGTLFKKGEKRWTRYSLV